MFSNHGAKISSTLWDWDRCRCLQCLISHSKILGAWIYNTCDDILPAIGAQRCLDMYFLQFSINYPYVCIYEKMSELKSHVSLFSNRPKKVLQSRESAVQLFKYFLGPSSHNWRATLYRNVFMTVFHKCGHMCYLSKQLC